MEHLACVFGLALASPASVAGELVDVHGQILLIEMTTMRSRFVFFNAKSNTTSSDELLVMGSVVPKMQLPKLTCPGGGL